MRTALLPIATLLLLCACSKTPERRAPPPQSESGWAALEERLLRAESALAQGQAPQALARLGRRPAGTSPEALRAQWLDLRARAQALAGQPAAAVQTSLDLLALAPERLRQPDWEREQHQRLWRLLVALPDRTLGILHEAAQGQEQPWYRLALLYQSAWRASDGDPHPVLESWQADHPHHPANRHVLPDIMRQLARRPAHPVHIALLLPFSGTFAKAGQAVLDGFLAAWYAERDDNRRAQLSIYDARPDNMPAVLSRARATGVDFIVGPLEKEAISSLLRQPPPLPPVLTLNYLEALPESAPDNLVQFGLAPEDEARQAAERAWFDGHTRALILSADDSLGTRLAHAFAQQWRSLGGVVVEQQAYRGTQQEEYALAVKALINVDEHEARRDALRYLLGRTIYSEHYNRDDADCIFLAARPQQGRQIMPQLRYFAFEHIPVYSTSHIYSGVQNREMDGDLDGLHFVDIPWMVAARTAYPDIADQLDQAWAIRQSSLFRLYAMGVDAYRVIPALPRMARQTGHTHNGATGELSLGSNSRLHRRLSWADFRNGAAVRAASTPDR